MDESNKLGSIYKHSRVVTRALYSLLILCINLNELGCFGTQEVLLNLQTLSSIPRHSPLGDYLLRHSDLLMLRLISTYHQTVKCHKLKKKLQTLINQAGAAQIVEYTSCHTSVLVPQMLEK